MHLLVPFKRRFLSDCAWWLRYIPQTDVRWPLCQYFQGESEVADESKIEELVEPFERSYAAHQRTFEIDVESFWESSVSSTNNNNPIVYMYKKKGDKTTAAHIT